MYRPFAQAPGRRIWLVLRTARENLAGIDATVRRVVHEQDADVFVGNLQPMELLIGRVLAQPRFNMLLLGVFAAVALALAAIGIYGVIAYSVTQRTREIGIRMALGAQRRDVLRLVFAQGGKLVGLGVIIGLAATLAASRAMGSLLFNTSAQDPLTLGTITLLLGVVSLVACLLPASRATKVNPIEALRAE